MDKYYNKNVLVTGGLGLIGSSLARELVHLGAKVKVVDNCDPRCGGNLFNIKKIEKDLELEICDINNKQKMLKLLIGQDYLFNLAGHSGHLDSMLEPMLDLECNTVSQLGILEICKSVNREVKIIFASTRQVYGKPKYLPVNEIHEVNPIDVNGVNKMAAEWYHLLYSRVYGIRSCVLRLTNTYGCGMRVLDGRQNFLGVWIRQLLENQPIKIYGGGLQVRDFCYVTDCVDALLLAGLKDVSIGNIYNVGGADVLSLSDLAKNIVRLNCGGRYDFIPFPIDRKIIDIGDYYTDFSKISNELGWKPQTQIEDGLKITVEFYRQNREQYW